VPFAARQTLAGDKTDGMPSISKTSVWASTSKRLLRITWPFFLVVVALVLLATESLRIVSAARAYVGGESLWSKAQKEAVYSLFRYAQTGAAADYRDYRNAIAIPLGDRQARLELEKAEPDLAVAREGFLVGQNDPADIDGMIMLFRRFRDVSFMSKAIGIWARGDENIAELDVLAEELHGRIVAGDIQPATLGPILARIDEVNRRLTPLEVGFSMTLGEAARRTQTILEVVLVVAAALLVVAGVVVSARIVRRSEEAEAELYAEHDRAQVTLESIGDAVITTDERGRIDYLNPVAEALTSLPTEEVQGKPFEQAIRLAKESDRQAVVNPAAELFRVAHAVKSGGDTILACRDGRELAVDVSAAPIRDRTSRIIGAVLVLKDVTRERQKTVELAHQARHDSLTGLVNRREFEQRLSRALASAAELGREHAVLYLDLDRFKVVNDSCGHAAGDKLLRDISGVLESNLRERDTLARLGGDEFAILLDNCLPEDAARIAATLCQAVAAFEFHWEGRRFHPGISVGVVPIAGGQQSVAQVLSAADACCYKAKDAGRNRVYVQDLPQGDRAPPRVA
jgi:diguanylate cyclase (GGDEF)-like protein/PAS domain S-box-containing protein